MRFRNEGVDDFSGFGSFSDWNFVIVKTIASLELEKVSIKSLCPSVSKPISFLAVFKILSNSSCDVWSEDNNFCTSIFVFSSSSWFIIILILFYVSFSIFNFVASFKTTIFIILYIC